MYSKTCDLKAVEMRSCCLASCNVRFMQRNTAHKHVKRLAIDSSELLGVMRQHSVR